MRFTIKLFALFILVLNSCQSSNINNGGEQDSTVSIGGEKDEHGCLVAAGYTWSTLRQECVRAWEENISLYIINTAQSYQTAAFVYIDSVQHKAEIFVPEEKNSLILDKKDQVYTNGKFNLSQEDHCWTLSLNDTKLYQERK